MVRKFTFTFDDKDNMDIFNEAGSHLAKVETDAFSDDKDVAQRAFDNVGGDVIFIDRNKKVLIVEYSEKESEEHESELIIKFNFNSMTEPGEDETPDSPGTTDHYYTEGYDVVIDENIGDSLKQEIADFIAEKLDDTDYLRRIERLKDLRYW